MTEHQHISRFMVKWTPEMDATLVHLWGLGWTAANIGERMGISKNAVIGRIGREHRDKFPKRTLPSRGAAAKERVEARKHEPKYTRLRRSISARIRHFNKEDARELQEMMTPLSKDALSRAGESLLSQPSYSGCRWLDSNGDYCGTATPPGKHWCEHHHKMVFRAKVALDPEYIKPRAEP